MNYQLKAEDTVKFLERNMICIFCKNNDIEDDYHYLMKCNFYEALRKLYLPEKFPRHANIFKFNLSVSSKNEIVIKCVATFLLL